MELLQPAPGRRFVDGTLGGGGHASGLLERGASVMGVDRDQRALAAASARLAAFGDRFVPVRGAYADVLASLSAPVDGVLLDLGVSSPQLDEPSRGFSFLAEGPLDMRMGDEGETAAELVERLTDEELADVLWRYGDERFSRPIAAELRRARVRTTLEAVAAVKRAVPRRAWPREHHVATRTFQALRIAVNGELEQLQRALDALEGAVAVGGRVAIISFHSLEDRAVKHRFQALTRSTQAVDLVGRPVGPPSQPPFTLLTRRPVTASEAEVQVNPRARSAHLRAVERVS